MPTNVSFNGNTYTLPLPGDNYGWGSDVTGFLASVAGNALSKAGGTFTLTGEINFGPSYGLKTAYLKSRDAHPASAGIVRLGNAEAVSWRNAGNSADLPLTVNASNQLTFNGVPLGTGSGSVSSVTVAAGSSKLSSSGSPITTSGTITLDVVEANLTLNNIGGTLSVSKGGSGATTLTGYLKGNGTSAFTASSTVPASDISGTLAVSQGGTGATTLTGLLRGNGTSAITDAATVALLTETTGTLTVARGGTGATTLTGVLKGNGTSAVTASNVSLTTEVTGTLPVANGGSGAMTLTGYLKGNGTSAFTASSTVPTSDLSGTIALTSQVSGVLPIANGGTNGSTASTGLNNLFAGTTTVTLANNTLFRGALDSLSTTVAFQSSSNSETLVYAKANTSDEFGAATLRVNSQADNSNHEFAWLRTSGFNAGADVNMVWGHMAAGVPGDPTLSLRFSGYSGTTYATINPGTTSSASTDLVRHSEVPLTTKGDILSRTSSGNARQAVGTDTYMLVADSAQSTGLNWKDPRANSISVQAATNGSTYSMANERVYVLTASTTVSTVTVDLPSSPADGQMVNIVCSGGGALNVLTIAGGSNSVSSYPSSLSSGTSLGYAFCNSTSTWYRFA